VYPHATHSDELDLFGPVPTGEFEYDPSDAEIAVEVEQLRARVQAARSWGA